LFGSNERVSENRPMDAQTLPNVKMPNRHNLIVRFPGGIWAVTLRAAPQSILA